MLRLVREILSLTWFALWQTLLALIRKVVPPSKKDVSNEIVLITGSGSGLGRCLALNFAELGAKVVCCDINKEGNDETVQQIKSRGGCAFGFVFDCTDVKEVSIAQEEIKSKVGDVTILINNAGIVVGRKLLDLSPESIRKTFDVNILAHFWTTKAFLPAMKKNNHGHIVNIASIMAFGGAPNLTDYCSSKAAAVGFSEAILCELQSEKLDGINVTVVCPFLMSTAMFQGVAVRYPRLTPVLDVEWVAKTVVDKIRQNVFFVILSERFNVLVILKWLLPSLVFNEVTKRLGVFESMNHFLPRDKGKKE